MKTEGSVRFVVTGAPVPKARPRMNRKTGNVYTPKTTLDFEGQVAIAAGQAGLVLVPKQLYVVTCWFCITSKRPDLDNLLKSVLDGLQQYGHQYGWNDKQVAAIHAYMLWADNWRQKTVVEVGPVETLTLEGDAA